MLSKSTPIVGAEGTAATAPQDHRKTKFKAKSTSARSWKKSLSPGAKAPALSEVRPRSLHSGVYLFFPAIGVEMIATNSTLGSLQSSSCQQNFTK